MKKIISTAALAFFILLGAQAQRSAVFVADGKAIKGYDPVAFFTESRPVMGKDSLKYMWQGATWCFTSRKNLEIFKTDPAKYAPQYGGYCAYGTAMGHKAPVEIDTWSVIDGRLYFNYSQKVKDTWSKDRAAMIQKANQNWPAIKDKE